MAVARNLVFLLLIALCITLVCAARSPPGLEQGWDVTFVKRNRLPRDGADEIYEGQTSNFHSTVDRGLRIHEFETATVFVDDEKMRVLVEYKADYGDPVTDPNPKYGPPSSR